MLNREQQEIAYQVACAVRRGRITRSNGTVQLHNELGLKTSSAGFMIYVYLQMAKGLPFKRALSSSDTDYFLERIGANEGVDALTLAVRALRFHIEYREGMDVPQHANRQVLNKYESFIRQMNAVVDVEPISVSEINERFLSQVRQSLSDTAEMRMQRLALAPNVPLRVTQTVYIYKRNSDVVAVALIRANGVCELCGSKAPFIRKSDGTPYLEVHHRFPLADGGEDTVSNAIAICPNCHREQHFGDFRAQESSQANNQHISPLHEMSKS